MRISEERRTQLETRGGAIHRQCLQEKRKMTPQEEAEMRAIERELDADNYEAQFGTPTVTDAQRRFVGTIETRTGEKPRVLSKADTFRDYVRGSYPKEQEQLSLGRLLRGYIDGDWTGAEQEMRAMTSTPTTAGGVLIPTVLSARIIDKARNFAAVFRAGATTVPMTSNNLKLARATSDVTAAWYDANSTISESDAAFNSVDFTARKMATLVRVENELLADAAGIDDAIENSIAQAMALELDRVCLLGSGVAPEPQGLYTASGTNSRLVTAVPSNYDFMLTAIYDIRDYNFEPNAVIFNSRTAETLAKLKTGISSDNTPLMMPADYAALSKYVSNQVPNNLASGESPDSNLGSAAFVGQWSMLAVGLRQNIQIAVSADADDVFGKDQTLIRATWRGDVQLLQARAFSIAKQIRA